METEGKLIQPNYSLAAQVIANEVRSFAEEKTLLEKGAKRTIMTQDFRDKAKELYLQTLPHNSPSGSSYYDQLAVIDAVRQQAKQETDKNTRQALNKLSASFRMQALNNRRHAIIRENRSEPKINELVSNTLSNIPPSDRKMTEYEIRRKIAYVIASNRTTLVQTLYNDPHNNGKLPGEIELVVAAQEKNRIDAWGKENLETITNPIAAQDYIAHKINSIYEHPFPKVNQNLLPENSELIPTSTVIATLDEIANPPTIQPITEMIEELTTSVPTLNSEVYSYVPDRIPRLNSIHVEPATQQTVNPRKNCIKEATHKLLAIGRGLRRATVPLLIASLLLESERNPTTTSSIAYQYGQYYRYSTDVGLELPALAVPYIPPSPTVTLTETLPPLPKLIPTATPLNTATPTATETPPATNTPTSTPQPTETPKPTEKPLPPTPTNTPRPKPILTPAPEKKTTPQKTIKEQQGKLDPKYFVPFPNDPIPKGGDSEFFSDGNYLTVDQIMKLTKGTVLAKNPAEARMYAQFIYQISLYYGVNPKLIIAIARIETQTGLTGPGKFCNNLTGIRPGNVSELFAGWDCEHYPPTNKFAHFPSLFASLAATAYNIRVNYLRMGKNTVEKIAEIYCPPTDNSLGPHTGIIYYHNWINAVRPFLYNNSKR